MPVEGSPRRYNKKFLFTIEIEGIEAAHFETCSELSGELGVVDQHEGGKINVADRSPGKVNFPPVTLGIGKTNNRELYEWWLQVVDAAANTGEPDDEYKRNVSIVQLDRDGSELMRHDLVKCWPSKYVAGEWDAKAEENVIEMVELQMLRWDRADSA